MRSTTSDSRSRRSRKNMTTSVVTSYLVFLAVANTIPNPVGAVVIAPTMGKYLLLHKHKSSGSMARSRGDFSRTAASFPTCRSRRYLNTRKWSQIAADRSGVSCKGAVFFSMMSGGTEEDLGGGDDGATAGLVSKASESGYTRWANSNRIAIGSMASIGTLESAFLTYQKLRPGGLDLLCGASGGCADVLAGPYSSVFGVPLTIPGTLGYGLVALLALAPLLVRNNDALDKWTRSLILVGTTAMGVFAVYLSSVLVFKIGYPCPWCVTSAVLSISMCGVAWMKKAIPEKTKAAVLGVCTSLITAFACLTIFAITEATLDLRQAEASPGELIGLELIAAPKADTESSAQALRIGKKLKSLDAKMYGAYWCTHCFNQKQLLGKQAMSKVQYVECSNRGENNQVGMCKAANIPGFPTWDIDGKLYPGEQTLEELEDILGLEPFKD